jgi:hypothetical protein
VLRVALPDMESAMKQTISDQFDREIVTFEAVAPDEIPGHCSISIGNLRMTISAEEMIELAETAVRMARHAAIRRAA